MFNTCGWCGNLFVYLLQKRKTSTLYSCFKENFGFDSIFRSCGRQWLIDLLTGWKFTLVDIFLHSFLPCFVLEPFLTTCLALFGVNDYFAKVFGVLLYNLGTFGYK